MVVNIKFYVPANLPLSSKQALPVPTTQSDPYRMPADASVPCPANAPALRHREEAKQTTEPPKPGSEPLRLGLPGGLGMEGVMSL